MIELDELKTELLLYQEPLQELEKSLNLEKKAQRLVELHLLMSEGDFWNDVGNANLLTKENADLQNEVENFNSLKREFDDLIVMIDIANEENDKSLISEIKKMFRHFVGNLELMRTKLLLSAPYDKLNAIVKLNAGAGGTESCDWCSMLYRMYNRFCEEKGFAVKVIDYLAEDEAGIKSITFEVQGEYAYGMFRSENGIHRLVRISPFNAQGKRQTSFVSVEVMPDIQDDLNVEIKDDELKMEVYRASGAGGQHINKTSSAVRLIHIPTGIVVACQEQRDQFQNKARALQMLKAKLFLLKQKENEEKLSGIRGVQMENGWGSQIRSYVLQPYRMVKDLRTGEETGNTDAVLDGDIERFIEAYLKWVQQGCPDRKVQNRED